MAINQVRRCFRPYVYLTVPFRMIVTTGKRPTLTNRQTGRPGVQYQGAAEGQRGSETDSNWVS